MRRRVWIPLLGVVGMGFGFLLLTVLRPAPASPADAPTPAPELATSVATEAAVAEQALAVTAPPLPTFAGLTPSLPPDPTDAPTSAPTPLVLPGYFVDVEQGDTLWDIAVRVDIPLQAIIDANPAIDPNLLRPGDRLLIPDPASPTVEIAPGTGPTPELAAYVATEGAALNLRSSPMETNNVIVSLQPGTPLNVVGRTADAAWLQVVTPAGGRGWVMVRWVTMNTPVTDIPISEGGVAVAEVRPTVTPTASPTPAGSAPTPGALPTPINTPLPQPATEYPYISNVTPHARAIFLRGRSLGNRPDVFSKIGDSITVAPPYLTPIGTGDYDLREYADLAPALDYFSQTIARDANSFANTSLAAKGGWSAWTVLNPAAADAYYCFEGESPLVCEYRLVRPSVALIMLGTNDVQTTPAEAYEDWMRQTIEVSMDLGVIPVLSTIPEFHRQGGAARVALLNGIITDLAIEYDVPLWDYHAALVGLPNDGLSSDGVHPSYLPTPGSTDFTPDNLQYGMTVRNLTALQALDAVWREAIRS